MKTKTFFMILLFIFAWYGCLTYKTVEVRVIFNENSLNEGTIEIIYTDIQSSEAKIEDQQKDFEDLIGFYQGDQFLLDQVSDGIYVKGRELKAESKKLVGKYWGIFRNLKFDNEALKTVNDEYIIMMDDDDEVIDTNGKIIKSEKNVFISWPKTQKELYWKVKMKGDPKTYSLLDKFRKWDKAINN